MFFMQKQYIMNISEKHGWLHAYSLIQEFYTVNTQQKVQQTDHL